MNILGGETSEQCIWVEKNVLGFPINEISEAKANVTYDTFL